MHRYVIDGRRNPIFTRLRNDLEFGFSLLETNICPRSEDPFTHITSEMNTIWNIECKADSVTLLTCNNTLDVSRGIKELDSIGTRVRSSGKSFHHPSRKYRQRIDLSNILLILTSTWCSGTWIMQKRLWIETVTDIYIYIYIFLDRVTGVSKWVSYFVTYDLSSHQMLQGHDRKERNMT